MSDSIITEQIQRDGGIAGARARKEAQRIKDSNPRRESPSVAVPAEEPSKPAKSRARKTFKSED